MNVPAPNVSPSELEEFLQSMEQKISAERAIFAERAFGMGCSALTVPMLIILGLFYLFGVRSWTGLIIILVVESLAVFILAALFSTRSQMAAGRRLYKETILPEILAYAAAKNAAPEQILAATQSLPKEALLPQLLKNMRQEP